MKAILDVLIFRRMISPFVLQLLFWAGIGGVLYGTYILYSRDHWAWPVSLFFGTLLTRVLFERAILSFEAYGRLHEISTKLDRFLKDTGK